MTAASDVAVIAGRCGYMPQFYADYTNRPLIYTTIDAARSLNRLTAMASFVKTGL